MTHAFVQKKSRMDTEWSNSQSLPYERHGDVLRFVSLTIVTLSLSVLRYAGSRRTPDLYRPEDRAAAGIRTSTLDRYHGRVRNTSIPHDNQLPESPHRHVREP